MSMNKDQVKGRIDAAEGRIQEITGKLIGNATQEARGIAKKNLGKLQAHFGDATQKLKKLLE
jgi:uncharacterized protein YjbJ (UPF0337 family)